MVFQESFLYQAQDFAMHLLDSVDRWLLGFDEVGAAIEHFTGRRIEPGPSPQPAALEAFESLVARSADPRHVQTLSREGLWRRPQ